MNATVLAPDRLSDGLVAAARDAVRLPAGTRIVAAMSGGVDSTVTAAQRKTSCTSSTRELWKPVNAGRNCCTTNAVSTSRTVMRV